MPSAKSTKEPNRLVLCFDGTGNTFTGSNADTNVVKLLHKLDRHHSRQYHYYQTGVGTYDINEKSVHKTWLGEITSSISQTIDQAIGTTFDAHVMAGYRFLMRYYKPGDKIYMFGFSRGAFTARFLARMVHTVGLLCKGNEEMVPFAYRLFQRYRDGELDDLKHSHKKSNDKNPTENGDACSEVDGLLDGEEPEEHGHLYGCAASEIAAFSNTFCQKEHVVHEDGTREEENIKVYFLGIWDCVNSVAVLERVPPHPVPVKGTACFVRHAVAVDERRVKFRPALLSRDHDVPENEDIKEVWFPGCHGDVGGGWPADEGNLFDVEADMTWWQRFKNLWTTRKAKSPSKDVHHDRFQMSDVPLAWMIHELELVGELHPEAAIKWCNNVDGFKRAYQKNVEQARKGVMHDSLRFGTGTGLFTVLLWKFMEFLPIITRWEIENNQWTHVRFPLNAGSSRDIPRDAVIHQSLKWRLENVSHYAPPNNHGGWLPPCLKHKGIIPQFSPTIKLADHVGHAEDAHGHRTYSFPKEGHENAT